MSATARFSLERTIGLVLAVVLTALSVLSFVAHRQFAGLEQTTRWAIESRETVLAIESLLRAVTDAETGQRGYLLTSQDSYLAPYRSGVASTVRQLADIKQRIEADALQLARFDRLQALTQSKLAELAYTVALHPVDEAAALAVVRGNGGQQYMDEIRSAAATMSRHEQTQLASRSAAVRAARSRTEWLLGGALALLFAFAGAAYGLVRSELRRRADAAAELLESRRRLMQNEALLKTVTDHMPGLIAYIDRSETYRFTNAYYETLYGLEPASFLGKTVADVLGPEAHAAVRGKIDAVLRGEPCRSNDKAGRAASKPTSRSTTSPTPTPTARSAAFSCWWSTSPNASSPINDSLGHDNGDRVLCEFAARLDAVVRSTDLAARLGGDEFVVLLEGARSEEDARQTARRILAAMRADFTVAGGPLRVTSSIGVAFSADANLSAQRLLKHADEALYEAKRAGRDRFHLSGFKAACTSPAPCREAVAVG